MFLGFRVEVTHDTLDGPRSGVAEGADHSAFIFILCGWGREGEWDG